jgi:hypothetical protein
MSPVGAGNVLPPVQHVARTDRAHRHAEHRTAWLQQVWVRPWIECRIKRPLGERHVAGGGDERGEVGISDSVPIDPEAIDGDAVRRPLLGIMRIRSHPEGATCNLGHTLGHVRPETIANPIELLWSSELISHFDDSHLRRLAAATAAPSLF